MALETNVANAAFWDEPCGSWLARSIGFSEPTAEALAQFDAAYLGLYPYLLPLVDRIGVRDAKVLEVGLGYGTLGGRIAAHAGEYHGLDIAREPVTLMNLRLERLGRPALARQGSALEMPYPDATFDVVVSIGTLHHTGDLPRAIGEVRRVLRPGGRALLMVYNRWSLRQFVMVPAARVGAALRLLARTPDEHIRSLYDTNTGGTAAPVTVFTSPPELRRLLSGFSSVRLELHNMDGLPFVPRRLLLGNVDRVVGLDIYAMAQV